MPKTARPNYSSFDINTMNLPSVKLGEFKPTSSPLPYGSGFHCGLKPHKTVRIISEPT
jgi:hypothetical protein